MNDTMPGAPPPSQKALVDIVPLGRVDELVVEVVAANLQAVLGLWARVCPPLPVPAYANLAQRGQFDAGPILKDLATRKPGAPLQLGLCEFDLCVPILTFVYGESQVGGRAGVVSLHRLLDRSQSRYFERAAKITIHEIGHVLGLGHCWDIKCLMHFSRNLEQLDSLPVSLCPNCAYEAARLRQALFAENRLLRKEEGLDKG